MEEKVCQKCGYELFPSDKECDKCGTKVAAPAAAPASKPANTGRRGGANAKNKSTAPATARTVNQPANSKRTKDIYGVPIKNQNVEIKDENKTLKIVLIVLAIVLLIAFVVGIIIFGINKVNNGDFEGSLFSSDDEDYDDDEEPGAKKGLFDLEITIPEEYVYDFEFSQEDFDTMIESGGAKDVVYNDDGSVTVIMSKVQHKVAIGVLKKYIKDTIKETVEDGFYDGVTKIDFNDDFTSFTVHTESSDYSLDDDMVREDMYYQSCLFAVCSGKEPGSISIELVDGSNNSYQSEEYGGEEDYSDDGDVDFGSAVEAEDEMIPIETVY